MLNRNRKGIQEAGALRVLVCLLCLAGTLITFIPHAYAVEDPQDLTSKSCLIYNLETDSILYGKDINELVYPTATVKILVALMALEYYADDLDRVLTVTNEAVSGTAGTSSINLAEGEEISVRNLIYALLVIGANDASSMLAYHMAGNVTAFVTRMNARLREMGCNDTVFTNVTGLHDENMVTTARDMLTIAQAAYNNPNYMSMSSVTSYTIPATNKRYERILYNRNFIVSTQYYTKYYNPLAKGICAGNTREGGYCLVTSVRKSGCTYLVVCMGSYFNEEENYIYTYKDCKTLVDWAYENYDFVNVIDTTTMVCEIPVNLSQEVDYATLLPEEPVKMFLPREVDVATAVTLNWVLMDDTIEAPVKEGQIAGILSVLYNGKLYTTVNLVTKNDISRSEFLYLLSVIRAVVTSQPFFIACGILLLLGLYYVLFTAVYREKQRKREEKRKKPNLSRR